MARKYKRRTPREEAETIVRKTRWGPAQVVRVVKQWSDQDEDNFLDCLVETCNVRSACQAAGVATTSVYRQRLRRADFALKWQAALEQGYAELELELVGAATRALRGEEVRQPVRVEPMSAETALKVLTAHRAAIERQGKKGGLPLPRPTLEEVQDGILAKIAAIKRARRAPSRGEAARGADSGDDSRDGATPLRADDLA